MISGTMWDIFNLFDQNKDEKLQPEEIFAAFQSFKLDALSPALTEEDFETHLYMPLAAHCDHTKKTLTYESIRWSLPPDDPRTLFEMMDEDKDKKVTPTEFFKPFYMADTRKDYAITPDELNAYIHKYYVNICMRIRTLE